MLSSSFALVVDFGSTYTKAICVDLETESIVARAQAVTTIETNIMDGLSRALEILYQKSDFLCPDTDYRYKIACSSAAGGLRMIVAGLVPGLTLEAGRQAALGAGAKVIGSYHHRLTQGDIKSIEGLHCDIFLLTGGTDGGDEDCILHNAYVIAKSKLSSPIIVAGNRAANEQVRDILINGHKKVEITENVLPTLDELNVEPARELIRELFIRRIVKAKGLSQAQEYFDGNVVMPTPMAVLKGAELLADGYSDIRGFDELLIVDVGGATTDVHSVAQGQPTRSHVVTKGLMPPYAQRTVEGDLGIRYNARNIVNQVNDHQFLDELRTLSIDCSVLPNEIFNKCDDLSKHVNFTPCNDIDYSFDSVLARFAVDIAVNRHAATLKPVYLPEGQLFIQTGKDLSNVKTVIGVGGIFVYGQNMNYILKSAVYSDFNPFTLKPKNPSLYIDRNYILYAVGLLRDIVPGCAINLARKYLVKCE